MGLKQEWVTKMTNDEFVEQDVDEPVSVEEVEDALRRAREMIYGVYLDFVRFSSNIRRRSRFESAHERKAMSDEENKAQLTAAAALSLANKAEQGVVQKTIDDILAEVRMYATMGVTEYSTFLTCDDAPVVGRLFELGYEAAVAWTRGNTKKLYISWKAGGNR